MVGREERIDIRRESEMKYAGADWLVKSYPEIKPSPLGLKVADIMGMVENGLYHMDLGQLKKINWSDPYVICIKISGSLSTFDWNNLTELVILCHDQAIRLSIDPCMRFLRLLFHQRKREGHYNQRHPTIEEAIESCRKRWNEGSIGEIKVEWENPDSWPDWQDTGKQVCLFLTDGTKVTGKLLADESFTGEDEVPVFTVRTVDGRDYSFADAKQWGYVKP
jgi:hypothetical protein